MKGERRFIGDCVGAAALEFALIGLPFVLLLFGLVEVGRGLHIRTALDAAADRAQRVVLIDPTAGAETIEAAIRNEFQAGKPGLLAISYATESFAGVEYRLVMLNYTMNLLLPAPLGGTISIGSTRRIALVH